MLSWTLSPVLSFVCCLTHHSIPVSPVVYLRTCVVSLLVDLGIILMKFPNFGSRVLYPKLLTWFLEVLLKEELS